MTDRELLEAAARAAGLNVRCVGNGEPDGGYSFYMEPDLLWWNPIADDGDALRLAVELNLDVTHWGGSTNVNKPGARPVHAVEHWGPNGDHLSATRRAIVRAAAAIGGAK